MLFSLCCNFIKIVTVEKGPLNFVSSFVRFSY